MNMIGPKSIKVPDCPSKILRPIPWYKGRVRPTCFSCCLNPDWHATWRVAMARRYIWIITRRAPEMLSSTSCTCAPMRSTLSLALGLIRLCSYPDIMEPTWYVTVRTYHDFMELLNGLPMGPWICSLPFLVKATNCFKHEVASTSPWIEGEAHASTQYIYIIEYLYIYNIYIYILYVSDGRKWHTLQ